MVFLLFYFYLFIFFVTKSEFIENSIYSLRERAENNKVLEWRGWLKIKSICITFCVSLNYGVDWTEFMCSSIL